MKTVIQGPKRQLIFHEQNKHTWLETRRKICYWWMINAGIVQQKRCHRGCHIRKEWCCIILARCINKYLNNEREVISEITLLVNNCIFSLSENNYGWPISGLFCIIDVWRMSANILKFVFMFISKVIGSEMFHFCSGSKISQYILFVPKYMTAFHHSYTHRPSRWSNG